MKYILVVLLFGSSNNATMHTEKFFSKVACERAADVINSAVAKEARVIFCISDGPVLDE